jgi:thiol:disulfide interchange protein DsbA
MKRGLLILTIILCSLLSFPFSLLASTADLPGNYKIIENEPSISEPGKVILLEFADFYCPHCHMFEKVVVSKLKKEFGNKLDVRMIGFPVMKGKLPTAFEMYEQATMMGKGQQMKEILFRTIHKEKINVLDKSLRAVLIREAGLNVAKFEEGMATGKPYQNLEKGIAWGERVHVMHTPTVILNGNLRIENLNEENLRTVIKGLLQQQ